ncbi:hypothetical protein [Prescottella subtropica]|nr:hypothetical protein [Prescottella subtropica]
MTSAENLTTFLNALHAFFSGVQSGSLSGISSDAQSSNPGQ